MSREAFNWTSRLAALALVSIGAVLPVIAGTPEAPGAGAASAQLSPTAKPEAPPLPVAKSPVETFRELLSMNPEERRVFLAGRPIDYRARIQAKIRDYEAMRPEDRELRLQVTELRWFLVPLLNLPATNRPAYLLTVPEQQRKLLEARLEAWDNLSPEAQKQLLENEATLDYLNSLALTPQASTLKTIPPERLQKLQAGVRDWQALSEAQRRRILSHFDQFFELSAQEQARTLETLSEAERKQIERTLSEFGRLPSATRAECIRSFEKFARLRPEEQQRFLKSAERWSQMTPSERQAWKNLVYRLTPRPPLPPSTPPGKPPPLPPGVAPHTPMLATNLPNLR